jgi:uncharacterized RDD family membrane protein YckC
MKTIDIITSHNVIIEYSLASVGERFLAFLIDIGLLFIWLFMVILIARNMDYDNTYLVYYLLYMPMLLVYHLTCETFFGGQSLGKYALGIKVVKLNGQNPGLSECLLRWIFRPIDIGFTAGAFAVLFASSNDKSQRLGDMIAKTVVIRLNPPYKYSVNDLMNIGNNVKSDNYNITYPQVTIYTDNDMLYVKNVLERYYKYPNSKHRELMEELSRLVCQQLKIDNPPKDIKSFFKTLLQDYIILTR